MIDRELARSTWWILCTKKTNISPKFRHPKYLSKNFCPSQYTDEHRHDSEVPLRWYWRFSAHWELIQIFKGNPSKSFVAASTMYTGSVIPVFSTPSSTVTWLTQFRVLYPAPTNLRFELHSGPNFSNFFPYLSNPDFGTNDNCAPVSTTQFISTEAVFIRAYHPSLAQFLLSVTLPIKMHCFLIQ